MNKILQGPTEALLQPWFSSDTLLVFDYDGTLAPIVDEPACADMREQTRDLLTGLSHRFDVAIISGRSRRDVLGFLEGITLVDVIGNHGAEVYGSAPRVAVDRIFVWQKILERRLAGHEGLVIEDKGLSLSVHYRRSSDPAATEAAIRSAARDLPGARLVGGKFVVNVVIDNVADKGLALLRLMARLGSPRAVYVGDDETDEDVFRRCARPEILRIRIGPVTTSAAEWLIEDQSQIDLLLEQFLHGAKHRSVVPLLPNR